MIFDKYKENLIRHELGHWFIAKYLGYSTGDIEIKIMSHLNDYYHSGSSHINLHPSLKSLDDLKSYLSNRVTILCAGAAFQSTSDERESDDIWVTDGVDDKSKADELILILRGIMYPDENSSEFELEQRFKIHDMCWKRVGEIYEENKEVIEKMVKNMKEKVKQANTKYVFSFSELTEMSSFESLNT